MIIRISYHTYGKDGNIDKQMSMYFNPEREVFTISPSAIIFEQPIVNGQDILSIPQIDKLTCFDGVGDKLFQMIKKDLGR